RVRTHARRMAARSLVQRLSLERLWLCADLAAMARPGRGAHRYLGPHVYRRRGLCIAAVLADDRADTRRPWLAPALSAAAIAALAIYGAVRLERIPTSYIADVRLRIMQPNLQQDEKFNYSQKQQVMRRYIALSDRPNGPQSTGLRGVTLLIWPESAFPFFLTREPDALAQIAALLPPETVLITGAIRAPETATNAPVTRAYNSIYVIGHDGSI